MDRIEQYYRFIKEAEQLKSVCRTAWAASGRRESTAEHSWRLALLASLFIKEEDGLDRERVLVMCLIHDLGEIYDGDISAAELTDEKKKYSMERAAVQKMFALLPEDVGRQWYEIWEEYNSAVTAEARLVKALDKAETIIQHNQGKNPEGFTYNFNLQYGLKWFQDDEKLKTLRALTDEETMAHIAENSSFNA